MSSLKRLERLVKSAIPRFLGHNDQHYSHSDARLILTGFGLDLTPAQLARLADSAEVLEDFTLSLYSLERKIGRSAVNDLMEIDPELNPKAYAEDGNLAFTITWKKKELVFAEYPEFPG